LTEEDKTKAVQEMFGINRK